MLTILFAWRARLPRESGNASKGFHIVKRLFPCSAAAIPSLFEPRSEQVNDARDSAICY